MLWLIGLILGLSGAIFGYLMYGGNVMVLWQPAELFAMFGLSVGYVVASSSGRALKMTWQVLPRAFVSPKANKMKCMALLGLLYEILQRVRIDGLMAIENDIEDPINSALFMKYPTILEDDKLVTFICDYFRIMLSGSLNQTQLESLMDQEIETHEQENRIPVSIVTKLGDALPAFGIIIAVLGVIQVMGSIGLPPVELGKLIGSALVGTFLGVLLSYAMVSPLASVLEQHLEMDSKPYVLVKATIMASIGGAPPQTAVEYGRKTLFSDVRPSFYELEDQNQNVAASRVKSA